MKITAKVTAKEVVDINGLSPKTSPHDVWKRWGGVDKPSHMDSKARLKGGLKLVAFDEYKIATGCLEGTPTPDVPEQVIKEVTPTATVWNGNLVLLKVASAFIADEFCNGSVPASYEAEALVNCELFNKPYCDIATIIGGYEFNLIRIERNEETCSALVQKAISFRKAFDDGKEEPEIDESLSTKSRILEMKSRLSDVSQDSDDMLPQTEETDSILLALKEKREAFDKAETEKEEMELKVKTAIGDKAGIIGPDGIKVTYKNQSKKTTDWKGIAQKMEASQEVIDANTSVSQTRVLRFSVPKTKKQK